MSRSLETRDRRPLIAHILFSLDYGGLENGVVNLVNGLPEDAFRHTIIALTAASEFRRRITRPDVTVREIGKRPGKDPAAYLRLYRLLRTLRPQIVHTRNLSTIEGALIARVAGTPVRIHGEHGWDIYDPDGTNRKYRALRRLVKSSVTRYVALSQELERWLVDRIGVPATRVVRICNGVDTMRFRPRGTEPRLRLPERWRSPGSVIVGTVIRFSAIKDPLNLVEAFIRARRAPPGTGLRLAMIGDGVLRADAQRMLQDANLADDAWLPGSRDDVPELMREFDVFVLGSRREGISNTVLEAMATGLPVIATKTGGNFELVQPEVTGLHVRLGDPEELAQALLHYATNSQLCARHGLAARARAEQEFSLPRMLADYEALYRNSTAPRTTD